MELRKDPITRSWVAIGHPEQEEAQPPECPLCPENRIETHVLLSLPPHGPWQVRAFPHLWPLYRVEGDPSRAADGIFDRMEAIGAHEVIVESPDHARQLAQLPDEEIQRVLEAWPFALRT